MAGMNCPHCTQALTSKNRLLEALTPHQFQIARRFALGLTRTEVAAVMGISPHCASQTLLLIKDKLGVRNDVELALFFCGLLDQAQQKVEELP